MEKFFFGLSADSGDSSNVPIGRYPWRNSRGRGEEHRRIVKYLLRALYLTVSTHRLSPNSFRCYRAAANTKNFVLITFVITINTRE